MLWKIFYHCATFAHAPSTLKIWSTLFNNKKHVNPTSPLLSHSNALTGKKTPSLNFMYLTKKIHHANERHNSWQPQKENIYAKQADKNNHMNKTKNTQLDMQTNQEPFINTFKWLLMPSWPFWARSTNMKSIKYHFSCLSYDQLPKMQHCKNKP